MLEGRVEYEVAAIYHVRSNRGSRSSVNSERVYEFNINLHFLIVWSDGWLPSNISDIENLHDVQHACDEIATSPPEEEEPAEEIVPPIDVEEAPIEVEEE